METRSTDFGEFKEAVEFCYKAMKTGKFTSAQGYAYLTLYGMNRKWQSHIIIKAENEHLFRELVRLNLCKGTPEYNSMMDKKKFNPELFGKPILPSNWEGIHNIKSYIDAPMHLLFLGVVKLINSRILDWAAVSKNETRLLNTFSSIIPSIYDLKLEWCKMFPLSQSDSFSGLVSENWLAVCRLSRWMYSRMPSIISDKALDIFSPTESVYKWKGVDLRKWLALRGLPRNGKISELKETIDNYLSKPETIPPICSRYTCPIDLVSNSLITMNAFIQRVMQSTYTCKLIDETDNYIKLFLSFLHEWDANTKNKDSKPIWLSSYSLLNLLNLHEMMLRFGPVRNLWEGGYRGEGILRLVKHHISNVQANWHICATNKFYQHKSLQRILEQLSSFDKSKEVGGKLKFSDKANNLHFYDKKQNLIDAYHSGQPISVFIDDSDCIFAVINNSMYAVFHVGEFHSEILSLCYFNMNAPTFVSSDSLNPSLKCFGLLLPKLSENDGNFINEEDLTDFGIYTVITDNWMEIKQDKTYGFYQFSHVQSV